MPVATHMPEISVMLIKTPKFGRPAVWVELKPYLCEGSTITTTKAVNSPHNSFTIRVGDRLAPGAVDSLYGMVEPVDAVEIRMSRDGAPQMVMRGIVTETRIDEAIGQDGKPNRTVTITGGDSGRFLQMLQIHFFKGTPTTEKYLGMAGQFMQDRYGIPFMLLKASEFVEAIFNNIINPHISAFNNPSLPPFSVDTSGADPIDSVYPFGYQANPDGTMWSHLHKHGNLGPFYEVLVEDSEGGVTLIYRKPAYKNWQSIGNGGYVFPTSSADTYTVSPEDISSMASSRSEHDVANWYFVRAARGDWQTGMDVILQSIVADGGDLSLRGYHNCAEDLYGFRSMEVDTNHGSMAGETIRGGKKPQIEASNIALVPYMKKQIVYLQESNKDNVLFESGSIRVKGYPHYRPGCYFDISWRSGMKSTGYVTSVTHVFEPFRSYTCTLNFIRGTGFGSRSGVAEPYFNSKGVYK